VLQLVEELDNVPSRYFRKLSGTEDLWEIRVQATSEAIRLLGFLDGDAIAVPVHAFSKKSMKTPLPAIRLAERRKREYARGGSQ